MDWRRLHRAELYAVAAAAVGAVYYLASGRAEGFLNIRILLVPVLALALVPTFYLAASYALPLRAPSPRNRAILMLGLIAGYALVGIGQQVDVLRVTESFDRGDVLIVAIEAYRKDTGNYPFALSDLEERGVVLPTPALENSGYWYRSLEVDKFSLSFPSVDATMCTRRSGEADWICED